ncbi:MAG: HlyD family efflux transporter periplasmic adaptor subunit, partial [Cyanobacteria bacterium J06638_38]
HLPPLKYFAEVDENDFMPAISSWTRLGGLFLVGTVGIVIALAAFTPYKVTVKAPAKVRPAGKLKIVEAKTEGTVVEINVAENQRIKRGDVIATIDSSRLQTQDSQLQSQIQQSKLQLGQIKAQIRTLKRQIQAEQDRIERAVAVATVELSRRQREYQDQQITTQAEAAEAEANVRLVTEEWQQAQAEFNSAQATLRSNQAALRSATSKRNRYQEISVTGALSQNQLEEAELEVEQQKQQVAAQKATVEQQKRGIARQQEAIEAAKARLNLVQAALNPSNGEIAIANQRIAQEIASGEATIAALNREQEGMIQQRIELEQTLSRDRSELKQITRDMEQTVIKAPENGVLFQLSLSNPSQTVSPGSEIARIAPDDTSLAIETLVSASDISNVELNQKAQVRISACPYPDYGTLKGVVQEISPDAIPLENNDSSTSSLNQASTYKVRLKPDSQILSQGKNQCTLQLGMEGKADVITKEETILKFLLRKARLIADL